MFKQVIAAILILAFSSQVFNSPLMMLDYIVNNAAYARNCINKSKPKMHCNGKCQLMKKMREEEKAEQQNAGKENKVQVLSSRSFFNTLMIPVAANKCLFDLAVIDDPVHRSHGIFHPPQA